MAEDARESERMELVCNKCISEPSATRFPLEFESLMAKGTGHLEATGMQPRRLTDQGDVPR